MTPPTPKKPTSPKPPRDRKAAELGEHIGKELRAMFQDVVAEPVPEKFQKLLDELERKRSEMLRSTSGPLSEPLQSDCVCNP